MPYLKMSNDLLCWAYSETSKEVGWFGRTIQQT